MDSRTLPEVLADIADKEAIHASDVHKFKDLVKQIPKTLRGKLTQAAGLMGNREQAKRSALMTARLTPSPHRLFGHSLDRIVRYLASRGCTPVVVRAVCGKVELDDSVLRYWYLQGKQGTGMMPVLTDKQQEQLDDALEDAVFLVACKLKKKG